MSTTKAVEKELLGKAQSTGYRPAVAIGLSAWGSPAGWGFFSLNMIDEMRRDWQVSQALAFKEAPIHKAKIKLKCGKPRLRNFIIETIERFWHGGSLHTALLDIPYGYEGSEVCYEERGGLIRFDRLIPLHPRDVRPFTYGGKLQYVRLSHANDQMAGAEPSTNAFGGVKLRAATKERPAKGFWTVHDPDFSPWYGRPAPMPAWWPWRCKVMPDGAMETAFKAFYKHAFTGMVFRHPNETYQDSTMSAPISAQEYVQQIGEQIKAGASLALSNEMDESGKNYKYMIERFGGEAVSNFQHVLEYPDWLDRLIVRGHGIPDEVLTHDGATGGFSRSNIAYLAFLIMEEAVLNRTWEAFETQVLRPLLVVNFGRWAAEAYWAEPESLVPDEQDQMTGMQPGQDPGMMEPEQVADGAGQQEQGGQVIGKIDPQTGNLAA